MVTQVAVRGFLSVMIAVSFFAGGIEEKESQEVRRI